MSAVQVASIPEGTLTYESRFQKGGDAVYEPFVCVGPVIGLVTETTGRVLVEVTSDTRLTLYLTDCMGRQHGMAQTLQAYCPVTFNFQGLLPNTYYRVTSDIPIPGVVKAGFRTLRADFGSDKDKSGLTPAIAFVRGTSHKHLTKLQYDDRGDLYKKLAKQCTQRKIDYVVHFGGNVSLSSPGASKGPFEKAVHMLKGVDAANFFLYEDKMRSLFADTYRTHWTNPTLRHVLANAPNLMVGSFEDVCWNLGAHQDDFTDDKRRGFVARVAYEVYSLYQRSLFEEMEGAVITQAHHFHRIGKIGFLCLDPIFNRIFHQSEDDHKYNQVLGGRQTADLKFSLSNGGYFAETDYLFIVSPSCLVEKGELVGSISQGSLWARKENEVELEALLARLFDWRAERSKTRQFMIVSGSPQFSSMSTITDQRYVKTNNPNLHSCSQITLSNIADDVIGSKSMKLLGTHTQHLGSQITFKHSKVGNKRSYGVMECCRSAEGYPFFEAFFFMGVFDKTKLVYSEMIPSNTKRPSRRDWRKVTCVKEEEYFNEEPLAMQDAETISEYYESESSDDTVKVF